MSPCQSFLVIWKTGFQRELLQLRDIISRQGIRAENCVAINLLHTQNDICWESLSIFLVKKAILSNSQLPYHFVWKHYQEIYFLDPLPLENVDRNKMSWRSAFSTPEPSGLPYIAFGVTLISFFTVQCFWDTPPHQIYFTGAVEIEKHQSRVYLLW